MKKEKTDTNQTRVLVLMPTGRDADLISLELAKVSIACHACADVHELCNEVSAGAGAALIAEEALSRSALTELIATFRAQPIWSDLPVILFSSTQNAERLLKDLSPRLNATIVERPIRKTILLSAVHGALRARQRQYETRDLLTELEEADKQKDLFLATLSHELRTPLNSIVGWIKLLRGKTDATPAEMEHALEVIERNARAQSEIISDILFVSRVVTNKLELKLTPIDVIDLVSATVDIMRPSFEAKGLRTEIVLQPEAAVINGDADRLQQVFLNLFSNAAKFTHPGGSIHVSIRTGGSKVEVAVTDSGRGIEPEFLPYVFERFRQAENEYSRRAGGLGLGLAIVRHLVELHGGTVSATSDGADRGATFSVILPMLAEPQKSLAAGVGVNAGSKPDSAVFEDLRVLLVEDDIDSREMLATFLTAHGMHVTAVDSAPAAIETIQTLRPDVLISDVGLPGQDGYEMIDNIRSLGEAKGGRTPAIALTGYASVQDRKKALNSGFQEHLAKPIDFDQLMEHIAGMLGRASGSLNGSAS